MMKQGVYSNMAENVISIGQLRMQYLAMANSSKTQMNIGIAIEHLDDFLNTIPSGGELDKLITEKFKEIDEKKEKTLKEIIEKTELSKGLNIFEQAETRTYSARELDMQVLKDRIDACWNIAMEKGLFHE